MGFMDQVKMRAKNAQFELVSLIKPEAAYEQWLKDNPIGQGLKEGMEFKMVDKEVARHRKMIDMIHETYKKKNRDYGDAFGVSLDKRGMVAALVRMEDKLGRLDSLKDRDPLVKDESLQDTLLDLANYAIMTAMWLERKSEEKVTVLYADNEPYLAINPEVGKVVTHVADGKLVRSVADYVEKREKENDHITVHSLDNINSDEIAKNFVDTFDFSKMAEKVVEAHEKMEFKEHKPLSPGLTLKPEEKVYITNHGSFCIEGNRLVTRNINGHVLSSTEIKEGATLVLRVVAE